MPKYGLVHLLDLPQERLEIIELLLGEDSRVTGRRVGDLELPEGSLLISVLRGGTGFVPGPETVLEAGDEVLAVLDRPRGGLKAYIGPDGAGESAMADRRGAIDLLIGGFAAAHCATELRRGGAEGSILLVGREPHPPYERPPLSKEYLRGESSEEDAYVNAPDWYEQNDVELLTEASVMSLDAAGRTAKLQTREVVEFGQALIATGARVNILHHLEGARLDGIHYLRVLGNADAIRGEAADAEHVVLIGGSYIASEVAASLTAGGARCTMVMLEDVAMSRAFGEEVGQYFHQLLSSHGVSLVPATSWRRSSGRRA